MPTDEAWPPQLPFSEWRETCETLHRWTQIVGKVRLVLTPKVNHWWNVAFHTTARGLTSRPIPHDTRTFCMDFDFIGHHLTITTSDGGIEQLALRPMPVADFHADLMARLKQLGIDVHIWTMPSEIDTTVPLDRDLSHAQYDPVWVNRFWQALRQSDRVLKQFRSRFIGKASPVHFFWGSFDLAASRFSGRTAPPPTRGMPNVASWVMEEAYSHEEYSCGFWPGNGGYGRAAYYAYAYPEPPGFGAASLRTAGASYDPALGEFILPYDALRDAADPDALLLDFLQETYEAILARGTAMRSNAAAHHSGAPDQG